MAMNESMSNNMDAASQKMNTARDRMSTMAHTAVDKAADMKEQAADWLSEQGDQLSATQKKLIDNTSAYVQANPLKSIGIAVVAALLVGRLLK